MVNPIKGGKVRNKLLTYKWAAQGEHHLGADVSDLEFRVWHVLLSYADKDGYNVRPTTPVVAVQCRRSVSAVKRALRVLEAKGAIVRVPGTGVGRGNAAVYTVLPLPGATVPDTSAPRFGGRLFARVNTALRRVGCQPLDPSRWLDPDDEKGSHANPFPGSADGRKGFRRGTEKGSPVNPHQGNYQWCADAPGEGEVPAGPADEWVPADEPLDDPEDEEIFPDDPDEPRGTPADHRADAQAEVLEQGQQQRNGRRAVRPAPRQPEAGRPLDPDATAPVAADGSATTRRRKATA